MNTIIFTVTNDLTYDQRMQRICTSVAKGGFAAVLVGRRLKHSKPLTNEVYRQKRLYCFSTEGKIFYLEYNIRLFFFLLFCRANCFCAIDLDTILPNFFASILRNKKRVYDAHELFTEQKEIVTRPAIKKMWLTIEKFAVPHFKAGYTVNSFIVDEFKKRYGVQYGVVRNLPIHYPYTTAEPSTVPVIIYQGAVNEGRSFETLIPAMQKVNAKLIICGKGNFFEQVQQLIIDNNVEQKVELKGLVTPAELKKITPQATIAVMLFENTGLNQYQSLANRFFDYIMAGVPQLCVNYPQYKAINDEFNIAYLINDTSTETIANGLNNLIENVVLLQQLKANCLIAREKLNWQNEEQTLIHFYNNLFRPSSLG